MTSTSDPSRTFLVRFVPINALASADTALGVSSATRTERTGHGRIRNDKSACRP